MATTQGYAQNLCRELYGAKICNGKTKGLAKTVFIVESPGRFPKQPGRLEPHPLPETASGKFSRPFCSKSQNLCREL